MAVKIEPWHNSILILSIIFFLCVQCEEQIDDNSVRNRKEFWLQDLSLLQDKYFKRNKSFPKDSIAKANVIINSIKDEIDSLSNSEIQLQLSKAIALANNAHTCLEFGSFKRIPLLLYWFSDGLYIISCDKESKDLLGKKIITMADNEPGEIIETMQEFIPGNKQWIKYLSTYYLTCPDFLYGMNVTQSSDSIQINCSEGGDTVSYTLFPQKENSEIQQGKIWYALHPEEKQPWLHVLQHSERIPVYLSNPGAGNFTKYIQPYKIFYIQINSTSDIKKLEKEIIKTLKNGDINHIVCDLRFNSGGDYMKLVSISRKIPKLFKDQGNIFIIVGKATFSAGICTAARLKYFSGDKAVIVGENIGDRLKFWAEGESITLPNSKLKVHRPNRYHDWKTNKFVPFKTLWLNMFYGVKAEDLTPNLTVENSYADYSNGRDRHLIEIINYIQWNQ